jgi:hypothetical protein
MIARFFLKNLFLHCCKIDNRLQGCCCRDVAQDSTKSVVCDQLWRHCQLKFSYIGNKSKHLYRGSLSAYVSRLSHNL